MKGVERLTRRRNDGEEGKGEAGNLIEEISNFFLRINHLSVAGGKT